MLLYFWVIYNEEKEPLANYRPDDHSIARGVCNAIVLHQGSLLPKIPAF